MTATICTCNADGRYDTGPIPPEVGIPISAARANRRDCAEHGARRYRTIVVDPPWEYRQKFAGPTGQFSHRRGSQPKGAVARYACMDQAALLSLPINEWSETDAHIYLWVTNAFIEDGFGLLREWGFKYKTALTWVKSRIGMGFYFRNTTEHVLFGVKGSLRCLRRDVPTHLIAPRGRHSEKPAAFYDMVETMSPGPYLDVFARVHRFNWDAWGNEVYTPDGLPEPERQHARAIEAQRGPA